MVFDPKKRITVGDALKHPYLAALHFPDDEVYILLFFEYVNFSQPTREPVPKNEFEFEKYSLSLEQLKGNYPNRSPLSYIEIDLIYEEILIYHFPDFAIEYEKKIKAGENPIKDILKNENSLKVHDD